MRLAAFFFFDFVLAFAWVDTFFFFAPALAFALVGAFFFAFALRAGDANKSLNAA